MVFGQVATVFPQPSRDGCRTFSILLCSVHLLRLILLQHAIAGGFHSNMDLLNSPPPMCRIYISVPHISAMGNPQLAFPHIQPPFRNPHFIPHFISSLGCCQLYCACLASKCVNLSVSLSLVSLFLCLCLSVSCLCLCLWSLVSCISVSVAVTCITSI